MPVVAVDRATMAVGVAVIIGPVSCRFMPSDRVQRRIDRLLDDAEAAADGRNWDAVLDLCDQVLRIDPDNEDAKTFLAAARRDTGVYAAGEGVNASATSSAPGLPLPAGKGWEPALSGKGEGEDRLSVTPDLVPASFANGRYLVSKFLGEGGKKRVYLAHDTLLDREVAFALIKTEGFDQTSKERISREAQAMGRLGVHPNIVAVLDLGQEDDGSPYMVTELMGGGDIEGVLAEAEENRLSLERTIEIGKAVCEGLEFAHARGIVHRDLKPGNVWLTDDGTAKIGDFGLAVMTDRSRLTREGMMVGTVSYMPPEQATGGEITAKADLYSLGAMLYEMVTGRPPFLGDDDIAIIGQHINTPPVAPTWHNGDCPRPLEALIMRLLSKDPSERPESAQDVFNALDAIDLMARGETVEREANSLESLAGGVFVGRQAEMGQLKAALEDVLGGRGRLVTLVGEPGIGKTRTSEELATYAGLRGAQVLWGRCYETGGQPPYWPWVQAIRSYVREMDPDELRRQLGSSASVIAEIVTDIKDRFPDLQPPPQMDDPDSARFRLFDSIASFLKSASQTQPLVIVLDDLHWSDGPTLTFLEFMARELGQSRVLLICTYRDMELNRRHPLTVTLGDLARERLYERVLLRGLSEQDVARFIEIAAGIEPPPELSATVHRHTEGNPLFVTEVVRELVQSGELAQNRASGESKWSVRIPEGVREVIGRRLDRLSERANEMLTTAAVIGRDFTLDALKELAEDTTEGQLLDVLDEALDAKIVEELSDALGHYQFTHALMQQTLTDELSAARMVRFHARIGEALERMHGDDADAHAAELVPHFAEAEPLIGSEKLIHYLVLAGEQALSAFGYEDAVRLFQGAEAAAGDDLDDADMAAILAGIVRASAPLPIDYSTHQQTWDKMRSAVDLYISLGDHEAAVDLATQPLLAVGATGTVDIVRTALKFVDEGSEQSGWLHERLAAALAFQPDDHDGARDALDRARDALKTAAAIGRDHAIQSLEARALAQLGILEYFDARPRECVDASTAAMELSQAAGDAYTEVRVPGVLGRAMIQLGDAASATSLLRSNIVLCRRVHQPLWGIIGAATLLVVAYMRGDSERRREAEAALSEFAVPSRQGRTLDVFGWGVMHQRGDPGGEIEHLLQILSSGDPSSWGVETDTYAMAFLTQATRTVATPELLEEIKSMAETAATSPPWFPSVTGSASTALGFVAIASQDKEAATELYDLILPRKGLVDPFILCSNDDVLGLLAKTAGRIDVAETHFKEAVKFCRSAGYRPELAWTCSDYAEMLVERDEPGDREKAIELQDEALAITQELGMRPLTERILARREILRA